MKCRRMHLGCLLNLFPGAEWLPGDTSSPSPATPLTEIWAFGSFRRPDLRPRERGDGNKGGQLRKRGAVYSREFVVGGATN